MKPAPALTVYFIKPVGLDGPIKIGCSGVPAQRVIDLGAWSPWPLELIGTVPGAFADEQFLHQCFAASHSHREWFHSTAALRDIIAKILAAGSIAPARAALSPRGSIRGGPGKTRTPDQRKRSSYAHRIRWALRKLRVETEAELTYCSEPADIRAIMGKWAGAAYRNIPGTPPTESEIARLEQFLARPASEVTVTKVARLKPKQPPSAIPNCNRARA
ncbi:MAG: hypothetical protein JWP25_439 [Bradyrhizobium sp.]|nr:hypothetical protein [Bradyrhizobium sp.]